MTQYNSKTLAEIVTEDHRAAVIFEKYRLDFCCKGKRSLQKACAENPMLLDAVINELKTLVGQNLVQEDDPTQLSLTELSDHIVTTHHAYVKNEMPAILSYLTRIAAKHGDRHPEMLRVLQVFAALKEEMELHMTKEEEVVFPRIRELEKIALSGQTIPANETYLKAPIHMMESEHDHAGDLLVEIRSFTNDFTIPADACTTYKLSFAALQAFELDLHRHVHLENNILFPKAMALFQPFKSCSLN